MTEELSSHATRAELIQQVNKISTSLDELHKDVASLLEIFNAIKGGVAFFIITVNILKWIAGSAVAFGAVYVMWLSVKSGKFPGSP